MNMLVPTRAEKGCIAYDLYEVLGDPSVIIRQFEAHSEGMLCSIFLLGVSVRNFVIVLFPIIVNLLNAHFPQGPISVITDRKPEPVRWSVFYSMPDYVFQRYRATAHPLLLFIRTHASPKFAELRGIDNIPARVCRPECSLRAKHMFTKERGS
jgi:hypothetical protein